MTSIIHEYKEKKSLYDFFCRKTRSIIKELLAKKNIKIHSVDFRVKQIDSIEGKISKNPDKYQSISDMTDIIGIRIITYLSSDLPRVSELIKQQFLIDEENSGSKKDILNYNEFGYLSDHYIASFNEDRLKLLENSAFRNLKFEVQIRTVLQHAWAEIEHDLGYKSPIEIPKEFKRKFAQLSSLLELVDENFVGLQSAINAYEKNVRENTSNNEDINLATIRKFAQENKMSLDIDAYMAETYQVKIMDESIDLHGDIERLNKLGISDIKTLAEKISRYSKAIKEWVLLRKDKRAPGIEFIPKGIAIFHLTHILAGLMPEESDTKSFYSSYPIRISQEFVLELRDFCKKISINQSPDK